MPDALIVSLPAPRSAGPQGVCLSTSTHRTGRGGGTGGHRSIGRRRRRHRRPSCSRVRSKGGACRPLCRCQHGPDAHSRLADNRHCAAGAECAASCAPACIRPGHGPASSSLEWDESLSSMPMTTKSILASAGAPQPWMSPSHPETPEAPAWDMTITVGENTAPWRESAGRGRRVAYHSHMRARVGSGRQVRCRDRAGRGV